MRLLIFRYELRRYRLKVTEVEIWLFGKPAWEMEIEGWSIDTGFPRSLKRKEKTCNNGW